MNIDKIKERYFSRTRFPIFLVLAYAFLVLMIVVILCVVVTLFVLDENVPEIHRYTSDMIGASYSIGAALIVAIPTVALFVAAHVQLRKNHEYQRAAFLGEYVSKIFTNKEFSDTFHYLIYTYSDDLFCRVKVKLEDDGIIKDGEVIGASDHKTMYRCLGSLPLQGGREEGLRLYHPIMFQGSAEERRLDSLLGYLNIVAYYYKKKEKLLSIDDIDGSIGYHLTVMGTRTVIAEYMDFMKNGWKKKGYAEKFGMQQPFHYLKMLLEDLALERKVRRNGR